MAWTLCTSGSAISRAGVNANSTIVASGSTLAAWSNEVEGAIAGLTRRDWVTQFASLSGSVQYLLGDTAASMIAKLIIQYDMSGYTSRAEAQTMLNVLDDLVVKNLSKLEDFKSNTIKSI